MQKFTNLVGVKTKAKTPKGSSANFCKIGKAKAAVLPLPVFALPITSLPLFHFIFFFFL